MYLKLLQLIILNTQNSLFLLGPFFHCVRETLFISNFNLYSINNKVFEIFDDKNVFWIKKIPNFMINQI